LKGAMSQIKYTTINFVFGVMRINGSFRGHKFKVLHPTNFFRYLYGI